MRRIFRGRRGVQGVSKSSCDVFQIEKISPWKSQTTLPTGCVYLDLVCTRIYLLDTQRIIHFCLEYFIKKNFGTYVYNMNVLKSKFRKITVLFFQFLHNTL